MYTLATHRVVGILLGSESTFIFNGRGRLQTSSHIARGQEIYA